MDSLNNDQRTSLTIFKEEFAEFRERLRKIGPDVNLGYSCLIADTQCDAYIEIPEDRKTPLGLPPYREYFAFRNPLLPGYYRKGDLLDGAAQTEIMKRSQ